MEDQARKRVEELQRELEVSLEDITTLESHLQVLLSKDTPSSGKPLEGPSHLGDFVDQGRGVVGNGGAKGGASGIMIPNANDKPANVESKGKFVTSTAPEID